MRANRLGATSCPETPSLSCTPALSNQFSEDICLEAVSDSSGWLKTPGYDWAGYGARESSIDEWIAATEEPCFHIPKKMEITTATITAIISGMALGALAYKYFTMPSVPTLRHPHVTVGEFMEAELGEQQLFLSRVFPPTFIHEYQPAQDVTCRMCLVEPANILTIPCNHTVMCQDCDIGFLVNVLKTIFQRRGIPLATPLNGRYISNLLPTQEYLCIVCRSPIKQRFKV